jgi:hypothetical protein
MNRLLIIGIVTALLAPGLACRRPTPSAPDAAMSAAETPQSSTRMAAGTWGGQGVSLTVSAAGAEFEFDCASARITEPLSVDLSGRITAEGSFLFEGGPVHVDQDSRRVPARFAGRIVGSELTLEVVLISSNERLGPYTLRRGEAGRVRKCR